MVAATTAACVRRKKYARRRPSVSHRVTRRLSQKTAPTENLREFRSIARVNPRPPGRRRRRGFARDRSRARERVETIRNISFRRVRPVSRAFARARRRRRPVVVPEPAIFRDRSIDRSPRAGRPCHVTTVFDARIRPRPHRRRAHLLDVLEGRHSLGLDGLLRHGRLGDDADAREGGGCERHDDVVKTSWMCVRTHPARRPTHAVLGPA